MDTEIAIDVTNLTKRYWRTTAVDGVSFSVRRGEIFGLLGPNGAGKSTIIKTLCGLAAPTAGSVSVNGFDCQREPVAARSSLGYVPEVVDIYPEMTATGFLTYTARFYDVPADVREPRISNVLEQVGLADAARRRVGTFSKGMRQRLALAAALVHEPAVLILDEPMTGLDPIGVRDLRALIQGLRGDTTILFSSHNLYEAEALCDRVVVLNRGRVVTEGSLQDLLQGHTLQVRLTLTHVPNGLATTLADEGLIADVSAAGPELTFTVPESVSRTQVLRRAVELGADIYELTTEAASLEEVFTRLLQEEPTNVD